MSFNSCAKKNCLEEWCALESIIRHGIVHCLLTHMLQQSIQKLFMLVEPRQKGLKNVNVKMTMFVFIVELGFLVMAIIVGYEAQSTPFPWSIKLNTQFTPFIAFWIFYNCDLSPLNYLLSYNSPEATQVKMLIFKFDFDFI